MVGLLHTMGIHLHREARGWQAGRTLVWRGDAFDPRPWDPGNLAEPVSSSACSLFQRLTLVLGLWGLVKLKLQGYSESPFLSLGQTKKGKG